MSKCNKCIYRAPELMPWECEYILLMGHSRPCEPGDKCTVFKKGSKLKLDSVYKNNSVLFQPNEYLDTIMKF